MGYHDRLNNPDPHDWPPRRPDMGSDVTRLMAMFQEETSARPKPVNAKVYLTKARKRKRLKRVAMGVACAALVGALLLIGSGLYAILLMDQGGR